MAAAITTGEAHRFIVRATYRHLFRAMGVAFKGDSDTSRSARDFARQSFRESLPRDVAPGTHEMAQRIEHAQGVTKILRENIVQGKQAEKQPDTYKLRFTENTQRFDNEETRKLKGTTKSFKEIKDAQF